MRREQGERLQLGRLMHIFEDCLGDADPVVGAGATADLVENQQTPRRGMRQDVGGLHHLHHEGGEPARQLIVGAHPGKDAVTQTNDGARGRDEAADLGQRHDDPGLPEIGRLAGHVRPTQEYDRAVRAKTNVVWDEPARSECGLDQRVASTDELYALLVTHDRLNPTLPSRDSGQRGDRVELAEPCRRIEQVAPRGCDPPAELSEELMLARDRRALGVEDQRLFFFELLRDVALAIDQRLLAHVFGRDRLTVRVAHLEVVAEYLVEPDFQGPDPAAMWCGLLEPADPVSGRPRAGPDAVQLGVEAGPKYAAILERGWQLVYQGGRQDARNLVEGRWWQRRGQLRPLRRDAPDARQRAQGFAQRQQVARCREALADASSDSLQVGQVTKLDLQPAARERILQEHADPIQSLLESLAVT